MSNKKNNNHVTWDETYAGMNKATKRIDKQKKSGLATNGFDKMSASVVVGSGSCACRDGDQTERMMLDNEGIRLPVTAKVEQKRRRGSR